MTLLLIAAVLLLAYSNGANDNFKDVTTLHGTGNAGTQWKVVRTILLAWVATLPIAALLAALACWMLQAAA